MNKQVKPGLLVEDANSLEVEDTKTGQQRIVKTPNRQRTADSMEERRGHGGQERPIHESDRSSKND